MGKFLGVAPSTLIKLFVVVGSTLLHSAVYRLISLILTPFFGLRWVDVH